MTGQIPDEFRYEGEQYSLIGIKGEGLYTPPDFGMQPRSASTACWRGYVMKFDCRDGYLILNGMNVNVEKPPTVNNVEPIIMTEKMLEKEWGSFTAIYKELGLKTKFTGSLLLGKDFIQEMYVHMGFQRVIAYRTVLEIHVENGEISSVNDLSEKIEKIRMRNHEKGAYPESDSDEDLKEWISQTFSLNYDLK